MKFQKYIAYTTIVYKLHISIYIKENAINMKVQLKVLLNVFLGLWLAKISSYFHVSVKRAVN